MRAIQSFVVEELSNWYVRNNRRRFWAKDDDPSKMRAYLTLYRVLEGVCRVAAGSARRIPIKVRSHAKARLL